MPLYTLGLWLASVITANFFNLFSPPAIPPFQEIFAAIGFSHKHENWYRLNNKYIIDNSLSPTDKLNLKNDFPNPKDNRMQDSTIEIYLYGRYIVNTKDRKIFCSLPYKVKNEIKYNCEEFNTGDLYLVKNHNPSNINEADQSQN